MTTVVVISPEPEARRILTLALELAGLEVAAAVDPEEAKGVATNEAALLLDMVDNSDDQWDAARYALGIARSAGAPAVLLLPRGRDGTKLPRGVEGAALIVRKPFELLALVEQIRGLSGTGSPAARPATKKATPSKPQHPVRAKTKTAPPKKRRT